MFGFIATTFRHIFHGANRPRVGAEGIYSSTLFNELDVPAISKRLNLEALGKERGARGKSAVAAVFDDVEQKIVTTIEGEKKVCYENYLGHLRTYEDRVRALGLQSRFAALSAAAPSAIGNFKARLSQGSDVLFEHKRNVVLIEEEAQAFRKANKLIRLAYYPTSRALHYILLGFVVIGDAVLNSYFFAKGNEFGLLGGGLQALIFSFINVTLGFLAGAFLFPEIAHRKIWRKGFGVLSSAGYVVGIVAFNLFVAHFREALGGVSPETAALEGVRTFKSNMLGLADADSWLLLIVGCLCSGVAAGDGWRLDDPYPGYGKLARRQQQGNDDYIDEKNNLLGELAEIRDGAVKMMETTANEIEVRRAELHSITENRAKASRAFHQHLDYLEQCANELLAVYRAANRGARDQSSDVPAHFSERWHLKRIETPDEISHQSASQIELNIERVFTDIPAQRMLVHDEYEKAIAEYRRIEQLTPKALKDGARPAAA